MPKATKSKRKTPSGGPSEQNVVIKAKLLTAKLEFGNETILQDAATQPKLFMEAVQLRVEQLRRAMKTRIYFDAVTAEVGQEIRGDLTARNEKITERKIEELIRDDTRYQAAQENKLPSSWWRPSVIGGTVSNW
jgi:hypothetical protein